MKGAAGRGRAALLALALSGCAGQQPPAFVREHAEQASAGRVPVLAFVDFECSYCRVAHARLHQAAAAEGVALDWSYRHVPMRSHPHAESAARFAICAEHAGQLERAAAYLLEVSPAAHAEDELLNAAPELGLPREALSQCLHAASTEARLQRDRRQFDQAELDGVPIVYVGAQRFDGAQALSTYAEALRPRR